MRFIKPQPNCIENWRFMFTILYYLGEKVSCLNTIKVIYHITLLLVFFNMLGFILLFLIFTMF